MCEPNVPQLQTIDEFMDSMKNPKGWIIAHFSDEVEKYKSHNFNKYIDILNHERYDLIDSLEFDNHCITPEMTLPPNLKQLWYGYDRPAFGMDDVIEQPIINDELPELPEGLEKLDIGMNDLKKLPKLPSTLTDFSIVCTKDCAKYLILPDGLKRFSIEGELNELPKLPLTLELLSCMYCELNSLPSFLPPYLRRFNCTGNNITKLPPLPPSIEKMHLVGNPIKVLPVSIGNLELSHNLEDGNQFTYYDYPSYFQGNFKIGKYTKMDERNGHYLFDISDPLPNFIYNYCKEDVKQYAKYKWATDIISNWFLEIKYNPKYEHCKKRLKKEFDESYGYN